jgi:hypothetical protein
VLFRLGLRRGWVTVSEIEEELPEGSLSAAERWLFLYSLRAADVEIRDDRDAAAGASPEEPWSPS